MFKSIKKVDVCAQRSCGMSTTTLEACKKVVQDIAGSREDEP